MIKKLVLGLSFILLIASCAKDKLDFDMVDDIRFKPKFEIPIVHAKLSFLDLVRKDSLFTVNDDETVSIIYQDDDLFSMGADDFVSVPEQKEVTFEMTPLFSPFDFDMSFGVIAGVQLASTEIDKGYISFRLEAPAVFATDVDVEVTIKNGLINGNPMSKVITLPMGSLSAIDSLPLSQGVIDLSSGGINFIGIKADILNAASVLPQTGTLALSIKLENISIEKAEGDFGQRVLNLPSGNFDFDIQGLENFTSGMRLTNPIFKLFTENSIGISVSMDPDIDGVSSDGSVTSLNGGSVALVGPQVPGETKKDTITFDRLNSGIVDFIDALPKEVLYSGSVIINPTPGPHSNFLSKDSEIKVGMEMELPLELKAKNLLMSMKIKDLAAIQEKPEEVESVGFSFRSKNGFPFGVQLSVVIMDSLGLDSVDNVDLQLLQPAVVGANGRAISSTKFTEEVLFTPAQLEKLKKAKELQLKARLVTPEDGEKVIKILSTYNLDLKIAATIGFNIGT